MKKIKLTLGTIFFVLTLLTSCGKTASECKGEVRAYEFGREMATFSNMSNNLSLSNSIDEFSKGLGVNHPYESDNPCVKAGFDDEKNNVESPYNKEGKSWTEF